MTDLRDFTGKDRRFTGTDSILLPKGSTSQRDSFTTAEKGKLRFNESTKLIEYFDGSDYHIPLAAVPRIFNITPTVVQEINADDSTTTTTFTVTGENFTTNVNFKFRDSAGNEFFADTVTKDSDTQLTVVASNGNFGDRAANEPFDAIAISDGEYTSSSIEGALLDAITVNEAVYFVTAAGSLGTVSDANRATASFTISAIDPESQGVTFAVTTGALPAGVTLNSSTGVIDGGFDAVGSPTTSSFTVTAKDSASNFADRAFTITVNNS